MAYAPHNPPQSPSFALPKGGRVTQTLVALLVGTSLIVSLLERQMPGLVQALIFDRQAIVHGEVWRLITYPWIKTTPLGLVLSAVVLYLFLSLHERMWGGPKLLRFVLASLVGAAAIAVPMGYLLGALMPFADSPYASGPDAAIDALLMVSAVQAPKSQVMFGFVLPMQARTFVWLMVALEVVGGIMNQVAQLSLTLGGLAMGYLLITSIYRPDALYARFKTALLRRRRGLYVVPPKAPSRKKYVH